MDHRDDYMGEGRIWQAGLVNNGKKERANANGLMCLLRSPSCSSAAICPEYLCRSFGHAAASICVQNKQIKMCKLNT